MAHDRYGQTVTTSSIAARDAYVRGVDLFLSADAGAEQTLRESIAHDPAFAVAHVALARVCQVFAKPAEAIVAATAARATAASATARERAHVDIIAGLVEGKGGAMLPAIRAHLAEYPRDAFVLAPCTGVFGLIGFSGRPGREQELRNFLEPMAQAYGDDWWFRSALAFSQVETGDIALGLKNVEESLERNPRNANAVHIRSHAYYEAGEARAGLDYIARWNATYDRATALHCHLAWHEAIWSLELGHIDRAFAVYASAVHPGPSWGPPLNTLTDAASFLFRAELAGCARRPDLWREVSRYATEHFPISGIAFADVHAAIAHAMAGECEALSRLVSGAKGPAADVVAPLAEAFGHIASEDWSAAADDLALVLATHERIGGSRAQRDLIEYAHTVASMRTGRADAAKAKLATRRPMIQAGGLLR